MITHTKEIKEYRQDGSLMYECTMAFLAPLSEHLYDRRVTGKYGTFIRINHATKYKKDGSVEWKLIYNDYGEVIGTDRGACMTAHKVRLNIT